MQIVRLGVLSLQPLENSFDDWWCRACSAVSDPIQQRLNLRIILGVWSLWKGRTDCMFNGATPILSNVLSLPGEESQFCVMAGAKGALLPYLVHLW